MLLLLCFSYKRSITVHRSSELRRDLEDLAGFGLKLAERPNPERVATL